MLYLFKLSVQKNKNAAYAFKQLVYEHIQLVSSQRFPEFSTSKMCLGIFKTKICLEGVQRSANANVLNTSVTEEHTVLLFPHFIRQNNHFQEW